MITRREFLRLTAAAAAATALHTTRLDVLAQNLTQAAVTILDPLSIPKYASALVIPPAMPKVKRFRWRFKDVDYYEIAMRQFKQQILPAGFATTTVWGYGAINSPKTFNYPSFTIEAQYDRPVRVRWINQLFDSRLRYLPHITPVDPTLHWANPPGGSEGRDMRPIYNPGDPTPGPYRGPVPIVTHVHGAHTYQEFDGYAEAWWLPNAVNIPKKYARTGTFYNYFKERAEDFLKQKWLPGSAVFQYPNDQRAGTIWYHDHALGMTRNNVYAGPAGFYILRGGPDDLPAGVLPGAPYEIVLAVQDRSFNPDGSLFFPASREYFDGYAGPYTPATDVSPIWNPEFFGTTMLVNGRTWPTQTVEPRRYRLRFLNGCNARFLDLKFAVGNITGSLRPIWQIGSEGGFLPAPVELDHLLMCPAERADVIVDFAGLPESTEVFVINQGPDEPYGGGEPGVDFQTANPDTTGQVMRFVVGALTKPDTSLPPEQLSLPATLQHYPTVTRKVSLNEITSMNSGADIPIMAMCGTVNEDGTPHPLEWMDAITENPAVGATETWEIYNYTMDAHPIHLHELMFKVLNRERMVDGMARGPESWEAGLKDTVIAYPDEITRITATFDLAGLYVWHCHIVDHEDNEMMRPYHVGPIPADMPFKQM